MSMQNKHHIQVPLLLPKSEKQFYDVKTIFSEQIVLLVKVAKRIWDILQIIIGQVFPSVPFKGVQNILQIIIEQVKAFLPFLSVPTCTRHIGPLTQMPEEEERERGRHSLYQNDNKTQILRYRCKYINTNGYTHSNHKYTKTKILDH